MIKENVITTQSFKKGFSKVAQGERSVLNSKVSPKYVPLSE